MTKRSRVPVPCVLIAALCSACATNSYLSAESSGGVLSDETALRHSSGQELAFDNARVISANDEALLSKLEMIEAAKSTIDLA